MKTKRVFSGIKPSGDLTLGNYLGMLKPAMDAQEGKENIFCVVNYHAITVPQDKKMLQKRTLDVAKMYLAAGLDLKKSVLFVQSDIHEHTELGWILNCYTYFGETSRQVQFKDKYRVKEEAVTVGFFDYPVLMAADILLYDAKEVPVGDDQKQHVELCRDVAQRFNKKYGKIFTVPTVTFKSEGARIMNLKNPTAKMSKSDDDPNGYIMMLDKPDVIRKKFAKAVTDSGSEIKFDKSNKPGVSNLLNIMSVCTGKSIKSLEKEFTGRNYGELKSAVADSVVAVLEPFQEKYNSYSDKQIRKILSDGAKKVRPLAIKKIGEVKSAIGINY
jgi:tryptophanyl-tRNA synthetase